MEALAAYDYPGNVRQLEHVIQRAVAIARPPHLDPGDLPEELFASARPAPQAPRARSLPPASGPSAT